MAGECQKIVAEGSPISKQRTKLRNTIAALLQRDVAMWLETMVATFRAQDAFQEQLITGVVLCQLLRKVDPATKLKVFAQASKGSYFARDNIAVFITTWKALHPPTSGFEVNDLVEGRNIEAVVSCLLEVGRFAATKGLAVPRSVALEREIEEEAAQAPPGQFFSSCLLPLSFFSLSHRHEQNQALPS